MRSETTAKPDTISLELAAASIIEDDDLDHQRDHSLAASEAAIAGSNQSEVDKEEELCGLVINVLLTVMWRGGSPPKERGSVIASINMLGKYLHMSVIFFLYV